MYTHLHTSNRYGECTCNLWAQNAVKTDKYTCLQPFLMFFVHFECLPSTSNIHITVYTVHFECLPCTLNVHITLSTVQFECLPSTLNFLITVSTVHFECLPSTLNIHSTIPDTLKSSAPTEYPPQYILF